MTLEALQEIPWADWEVHELAGGTLRLLADNDLTYHYATEVVFSGVMYFSGPLLFSWPTFVAATTKERAAIRKELGGEDPPLLIAFHTDASNTRHLIAADAVQILPGGVRHRV